MDNFFRQTEHLVARALHHEWVWRILIGLLLAAAGIWLARWLARALDRLMLRFQVEDILRNFLRNAAYAAAIVIVLIASLDFAGVPTTSLLAVVGAAGLAIGLALKDSLANIASGVMLILLRPFHRGDQVLIAGFEGTVDQVRIFQTFLQTGDHRVIILPNSQITSAPIINYTLRGDRRLDVSVGIAYDDDLAKARATLLAVANACSRIKSQPAPEVVVGELAESSVNLQLRVWVFAPDYASVRAELLEAVWQAFARAGLRIPFPQRDLHVYRHDHASPETAPVDAGD